MKWRPTRPRRGWIERREGQRVPVRFRREGGEVYRAVYADDGTPALLGVGDVLHLDEIGPGQGVRYEVVP